MYRFIINKIIQTLNSLPSYIEKIFTWKGSLKKYIQWTEENNYKILLIEGCSYQEAGFSFFQTSNGYSCAKMKVIDLKGEENGLYLMVYNWADAGLSKSRLVKISDVKFQYPYKIDNGKLHEVRLK